MRLNLSLPIWLQSTAIVFLAAILMIVHVWESNDYQETFVSRHEWNVSPLDLIAFLVVLLCARHTWAFASTKRPKTVWELVFFAFAVLACLVSWVDLKVGPIEYWSQKFDHFLKSLIR